MMQKFFLIWVSMLRLKKLNFRKKVKFSNPSIVLNPEGVSVGHNFFVVVVLENCY